MATTKATHRTAWAVSIGMWAFSFPITRALAQASPIERGANSLVTDLRTLGLPIAIIAVMVLGVMAFAGRLSAGLAILCILGICLIFGAPQLVAWAQTLFGVL